MWSFEPYMGPGKEYRATLAESEGSDREKWLVGFITEATEKLAHALGGYVSVSGTGHFNAYEQGVTDNVNVQISSFLAPPGPVADAGAEATLGSTALFPPEASTAAPATADDSPPAAQDPIPQPDLAPPASPGAEPVVSLVPDGQAEAVQPSPTEDEPQSAAA